MCHKQIIMLLRLQKVDSDAFPSRYLYIAGIGEALGTSNQDVANLFSRFGRLDGENCNYACSSNSIGSGGGGGGDSINNNSNVLSSSVGFENGVYLPKGSRFCYVSYEEEVSAIQAVQYFGFGQTAPIAELNNIRIFIRYAKVLIPKGIPEPECCSTTSHISVEGLHVIPDFLSEEEERSLLDEKSWCGESGPWLDTMTRRIQHYGVIFNYKTLMLDYSTDIQPIPTDVHPLVMRINSRLADIYQTSPLTTLSSRSTSFFPDAKSDEGDHEQSEQINPGLNFPNPLPFSQLTVNEYQPGQGITAHIDTESCLGPDIAIVCLASSATMVLQQRRSMSLLMRSAHPPLEAVPIVLKSSSRLCKQLSCHDADDDDIIDSSCLSSSENSGGESIHTAANDDGEINLNSKAIYNRFVDNTETGYVSEHEVEQQQNDSDGKNINSTTGLLLKKYVWLPRRSLIILRGEARYFWSHAITPRKFDKIDGKLEIRKRRVSLTFRQVMIPGHFPSCRLKIPMIEAQFNSLPAISDFDSSPDIIKPGDGSDLLKWNEGLLNHHGLVTFDKVILSEHNTVIVCDVVRIPLLTGILDLVQCVDVLERISHIDRRSAVIREAVRLCRVGGTILITVRAFEEASSDATHQRQDVLIPLSQPSNESNSSDESTRLLGSCTFPHPPPFPPPLPRQYLHLFKKGEIENLCSCVPGNRLITSQLTSRGRWRVQLARVHDMRFEGASPAPDSGMPTLARLD